jgi:CubicO group peptidase (beta-lactamase class C family)
VAYGRVAMGDLGVGGASADVWLAMNETRDGSAMNRISGRTCRLGTRIWFDPIDEQDMVLLLSSLHLDQERRGVALRR